MVPTRLTLTGRALVPALLLLPLFLRPTTSHAHAVGVSRGDYQATGAEVRSDVVLARGELMTALPGLDADRDGTLSGAEIERARGSLADWLTRGITIQVAAGPCSGELERVALTEQDGVELKAVHRCPGEADAFSIHFGLFADLSLGHRHLASAVSGAQNVRAVLYGAQPELAIVAAGVAPPRAAAVSQTAAVEPTAVAGTLFQLGVEHVVTGHDHLLLLLALVVAGGRLRDLMRAVMAFAIAHSITLCLAALRVWTPPPAFVGPAIAFSIAYVGIENLMVREVGRRWRLPFLFGLIYGFRLADAFGEVTLAPGQLPPSLAAFNAGVEVGQLAVMAFAVPLIAWLRGRVRLASGGLHATSAAISVAGLWWLVVRVAHP
jgi:hypothetical protein